MFRNVFHVIDTLTMSLIVQGFILLEEMLLPWFFKEKEWININLVSKRRNIKENMLDKTGRKHSRKMKLLEKLI